MAVRAAFSRQVPKYYLAQWLHQSYPNEFTQQLLDHLDSTNKDQIRRVFGVVCGIQPYDHVPSELLSKLVMSKVLAARASQVKFPVKKFVDSCISGGTVTWGSGLPVAFEWKEGRISKIIHYLNEAHELTEDEVINDKFVLHQIWDINRAKLQKNAVCYQLKDLFPAQSMIRQLILDKKASQLKSIADGITAGLESAKRETEKNAVDESVVVLRDTAIVETRKRAAAAAREKQRANKVARCGEISLAAIGNGTS